MKHESDGNTSCNCHAQNNPQILDKETGRLKNQRTNGDHPDYSIIKSGQNTEKSSEYLRRLVVIQTPVKDHQLTLVRKILKI